MSALLDEARSILTAVRERVSQQVNSGLLVTIDGHLARLEAAAGQAAQTADDAVHEIFAELYGAFHTPAADTPAPAAAEPVPAPAAEPPLATGGTVAGPGPTIVGESGLETLLPPAGTAVAPADGTQVTFETAPAPQAVAAAVTSALAAPAAPAADPEAAPAEAPAAENPASL